MTGWEVLLNRRCGPRWEPLAPDNTTIDGYAWSPEELPQYEWPAAEFYAQSFLGIIGGFPDPHLSVPHIDKVMMNTHHRIRGKRVKMLDARRAE